MKHFQSFAIGQVVLCHNENGQFFGTILAWSYEWITVSDEDGCEVDLEASQIASLNIRFSI